MYFNMAYKTIILYIYVIFMYRIMGKKEVGQLGIIDLIVSILIAELAALSIEDNDSSIFISIIPITVLSSIQLLFSHISMKSEKVRTLLDGKPSVVIKNGVINFSDMRRMRYTLDDLLTQLREQGIKSIEEVNYAVLENNGKLSIFEKEKDYPLPLILDGKIDYDTLLEIKHDERWIKKIIKNKNLNLTDIFYAFYSDKRVFIITKSEII